MAKGKHKTEQIDVKELVGRHEDSLQAALEAEMSETIGQYPIIPSW
jgi:hypothetical protein